VRNESGRVKHLGFDRQAASALPNLVDGPCGGLFGEEGVVAVINAGGVYAQLFAAHVGQRGEATSAVETQEATLAACIEVQAKTVADLRWPQATAIAGCDTQVRR
jgi:hypothetical protein